MRLLIAALSIATVLTGEVTAFDFAPAEFKDRFQAAMERVHPDEDPNFFPYTCNDLFCDNRTRPDSFIRAYSSTRSDVDELISMLMTNRPSGKSQPAFSEFKRSCRALLNIAMPELTEEEATELVLQWLKPHEIDAVLSHKEYSETVVTIEGHRLVGHARADQRRCLIYSE